MLKGIDVSGADVNWRKVRQSGATFCAFKLSEGQDFSDPKGTRGRYLEAHQAGLMVMPGYHYLRPKRRDATLEMRFYLSRLRAIGYPSHGDLPPVIDIEETELSPSATLEYLEKAARFLIARKTHPHGIIIYGSPAFLDMIGVGSSRFLLEQTKKKKLRWWIAHADEPPGQPRLPRGIDRYLFHQHSLDDTDCPGVTGKCDRNVARPDIDDAKLRTIMFKRGAAISPVAPSPQPPATTPPTPAAAEQSPKERTKEIQRLLKQIGWPLPVIGVMGPQTKQAVRDFKRGYAFKPAFVKMDASVGPITMRRLKKSARLGGSCSENFKFKEFASSHSGWIRTHRDLVRGLEKLRKEIGRPIEILSGFRDFNLGASKSQHKFGNAIDPTQTFPLDACLRVKAFSGIGKQPGTSKVRHLDVRHVGPNTTGGTLANPTVFDDPF